LPLAPAPPVFRPPARRRVADQIVDDLRDQMLGGTPAYGERLPTERELAERYGVSVATVREALSALAAMGMITVRHGNGWYVTVTRDTLMTTAIASIVRLERMGAPELMGILGALNAYAAELAATRASDDELRELRRTAERLRVIESVDETVAHLKAFVWQLSAASHNAILATLCKLLVNLQLDLAIELSDRDLGSWRRVAGNLYEHRIRFVEALEARDSQLATALVRAYHERSVTLITSSRKARANRPADPHHAELVSSLMASRVALEGGRPATLPSASTMLRQE
jgi:GntR family transcriptional repressor for pyruvate dehydrogenase complex